MTPVHLPTGDLDAELQRIGRTLDDAQYIHHGWLGDEYGLTVLWHDGFVAWLSFGARASALIAATLDTRPGLPH